MFFESRDRSRARRRGVVLILILGMLSLMALIGVTFATFAGQSVVNTRNFAAGVNWPGSEQLMDYALAQLINDTNNPLSAIRGHSLLRDMYGNDSPMGRRFDTFSSTNSGSASASGGLITSLPGIGVMTLNNPVVLTEVAARSYNFGATNGVGAFIQYTTNIPTAYANPAYYGLDFTRWIVRIPGTGGNSAPLGGTVTATFEVIEDDYSGSATLNGTPVHAFTLSPIDPIDAIGPATRVYNNPQTPNMQQSNGNWVPNTGTITLVQPPLTIVNNPQPVPFVLDGRYMRAFNGPGLSVFNFAGMPDASFEGAGHPHNSAAFANFLYNGNLLHIPFVGNWGPMNLPAATALTQAFGDPSLMGMDEDYDACDLENWFLALQSADGSVMIPSFHRPGILTANDWTNHQNPNLTAAQIQAATLMSKAKILRPRSIDNYQPSFPPDPSAPGTDGRLTYDVDNDGDGITDSVWLDLGYPVLRDPRGQSFKPLFAFMVLGLNGRLPLNTAGNLQSRDFQRVTSSAAAAPNPNPYGLPSPDPFKVDAYPQNFTDGATWSHASHLGYSVNEINPMFALQNAPNLVYGADANGNPTYGQLSLFTQFDSFTTDVPNNNIGTAANPMGDTNINTNAGVGNPYNSRVLGSVPYTHNASGGTVSQLIRSANAGVGIDIIQLRNLLAGTIPQDNITNPTGLNAEQNNFVVGGANWFVPDSMFNQGNNGTSEGAGGVVSRRGIAAVPGRWGEPNGIPAILDNNSGTNNPFPVVKSVPVAQPVITSIYPIYTNPVRAGKSAVNWSFSQSQPMSVGDVGDDDFDAFDFIGANPLVNGSGPEGATVYNQPQAPNYVTSSTGDFYDGATGLFLPVERIRRFHDPIDAMGVGRVISWRDQGPINAYDYGNGFDSNGRVMFFRYFRPAGMPKQVAYQTANLSANYSLTNATTMAAQLQEQQVLNQPVMTGPTLDPTAATPLYDTSTNAWHGYQSMLFPIIGIGKGSNTDGNGDWRVAVAGAMPYDLVTVNNALASPTGYANATASGNNPPPAAPAPTINGANGAMMTMSGSVNTGQGPALASPDAIGAPNQPSNQPYTAGGSTINNPYSPNPPASAVIPSVVNGYPTYPAFRDTTINGTVTQVVFPSSSLNKDEADEMNLYAPNPYDMPFGAADLEWLYRQHDIDGAQLSSRLGSLAPVSFLNPQDGLTRRRLFSVDSWETINFAYAPDNPLPVAYDYITSANANANNASNPNLLPVFTDPNFNLNSRFVAPFYNASATFPSPNATFSGMNLNPSPTTLTMPPLQNPNAITLYQNPLSYPPSAGMTTWDNTNKVWVPNNPNGSYHLAPIVTPSLGSRDRKINLNYPLPVSNDPAEPVRQKYVREMYQYFKAVLPPQAIDTPQELAQLSQFCVNVADFRDPDCSHTRFVNTDLMVIPATATAHAGLIFADRIAPPSSSATHFQYDPSIYEEQMRAYQPAAGQTLNANNVVGLDATWKQAMQYPLQGNPQVTAEFLVQHGMEYNPLAFNEVLAYAYQTQANPQFSRLAVEVLNTLTDDGSVAGGNGNNGVTTDSSSDLTPAMLDGWDLVLMNDGYGYGRPDPTTGELPLPGLVATANAYPASANTPTYQGIIMANGAIPVASQPKNPINFYTNRINGMRENGPQGSAKGAYYQFGWTSQIASQGGFGQSPPPAPSSGGMSAWNPPITQEASESTGGANNGTTFTPFPSPDATFPTNFVMPITPIQGVANNPWPNGDIINAQNNNNGNTLWCWLYLRRPANPFDARPYQYREMVTVDAIRFPFSFANGTVTRAANPTPKYDQATTGTAMIFSVQRLQPYRGGHLVPQMPGANANNPSPATCWGYTEQTANGSTNGSILQVYWGNSQKWMTDQPPTPANAHYVGANQTGIPHTFAPDTPAGQTDGRNTTQDPAWEYFPFNDRDFTGVAELMLVPGCPPGLFTKQFVENNDPADMSDTAGANSDLQPTNGMASHTPVGVMTALMMDAQNNTRNTFAQNQPRTYPYLVDKFYYSAASVLPPVPPNGQAVPYPSLVGGWTGDGWYKLLEFVEVPSSANGAIGPVAGGDNFDWFRQDTKPGLLNLNLIIDEEVFFGLMDDLRLNDGLNSSTSSTPIPNAFMPATPRNQIPLVVTQIDVNGYPVVNPNGPQAGSNGFHLISDLKTLNPTVASNGFGQIGRGFTNFTLGADLNGNALSLENHGIKAAFSDFLKLRAGGSGFLFAWGTGTTGSGPVQLLNPTLNVTPAYNNLPAWMTNLPQGYPPQPGLLAFNNLGWVTQGTPVARERPFRSLSSANINDTVLRPATLPPSNLTYPPMTYPTAASTLVNGNPAPYLYQFADQFGNPLANGTPTPPNGFAYPTVVMDPGIRNPFLTQPSLYSGGGVPGNYANYAKLPPLIPLRRLFQIPDNANGIAVNNANFYSGAAEYLFGSAYSFTYIGQPAGLLPAANQATGNYNPNSAIYHEQLYNPSANLIAVTRNVIPAGSTTLAYPPPSVNQYLGAGLTANNNTNDNRQHPYFRTELLQKVMNLTTVRTHQFAVWITIGFFEVLRPGSATLGQPDFLGGEIGLAGGKNIRYRSFFLLDRTRAAGFDPYEPGDFRDVVTYRRRIE